MRKRTVMFVLLFALAVAPLAWIASASHEYPAAPFGGGGGDAFDNQHTACGAFCGAILGWLVGKGLDYIAEHYNDPSGCTGANSCPAQQYGGGGGDAFPSDPSTMKTQ
jgi:hypothetical protein